MLKNFLPLLALLGLLACKTAPQTTTPESAASAPATIHLHNVKATAYYHSAIENKWVYTQLYELATQKLLRNLANMPSGASPAVILDIDETVLDNSPYELENIANGRTYQLETWKAWTAKGIAAALPGALEFCKTADSLGVQVFYLSNREVDELDGTLQNLENLGFPQAVPNHLLLKDGPSDKSPRRKIVSDRHYVALLLGDNLRDFMDDFKTRTPNFGASLLETHADTLRSHFVLFPNPMYGEWEKPIETYLKRPSETPLAPQK